MGVLKGEGEMRLNKYCEEGAWSGPGLALRVVLVFLGVAAASWPACGCPQNSPVPSSGGTAAPAPRGYALAIGLNRVDPNHYGDSADGQLFGCEADAKDMRAIAAAQGFQPDILRTAHATRAEVLNKLEQLAETLRSGDLLVVSFSGHGGQVADANGDEKDDSLDETWCLYDGQLLDDELFGAWMKFQAGVRILVFSDSCCSGTVCRLRVTDFMNPAKNRLRDLDDRWKEGPVPLGETPRASSARSMPPSKMVNTYQRHHEFYDELGKAAPKEDPNQLEVSVIQISACQDDEKARENADNGLFTAMLKRVWRDGAFAGNHRHFHRRIQERVMARNPRQSPKLVPLGPCELTEKFAAQKPYAVK